MFKSTRGSLLTFSSSLAIIKGLADDKGLYIPNSIPKNNISLKSLCNLDYKELSLHVLKLFFEDFSEDELSYCINNAYDSKFTNKSIAPIKNFDNISFLELFHGKTLAFKDMALSLFPYLLEISLKKNNISEKILILTATSGDTGKAALEGFKDMNTVKIAVLYPKNGTSYIQKYQMITQEGDNTLVVGIDGNFDDAQKAAKSIFNDDTICKDLLSCNYILSSANSINIGRFLPQIIYYFYSYCTLVNSKKITVGDKINFIVPTGNFGNILSAYYAKEMGLPINKLICASNENNVLSDFFRSGTYNINRPFNITSSPSMDILISSNLERLLYHLSNEDSNLIQLLMNDLETYGQYTIPKNLKDNISQIFYSNFASEKDTIASIKEVYKNFNYVIDPHTAVAYSVYSKYLSENNDKTETIIVSTASPYKFPLIVSEALEINNLNCDYFELINKINSLSGLDVPKSISELKNKKINHNNTCKVNEVYSLLKAFIKEDLN